MTIRQTPREIPWPPPAAVEKLFKQFERTGDGAHKTRRKLVDRMITELSIHAAIEEEVLYPAARQEIPDALENVLEALEEHHVVKWELSELDGLDPRMSGSTPRWR